MKCLECGAAMKVSTETYKYKESGLPNVTLQDIEVRRCPSCGEHEPVIPNIAGLHAAIAKLLILEPSLLLPAEIRFLRKHLGWSSVDFAKMMSVAPETVSRWENGHDRIGPISDKLLRLLVNNLKPAERYPIDLFANMQATVEAHRLSLREKGGLWTEDEAVSPSLPPVSTP